MIVSPITRFTYSRARLPAWAWLRLPPLLRSYVCGVIMAALVFFAIAVAKTPWHGTDLLKFAVLLVCGLVSVAATPRTTYSQGALVRDFISAWVLPVAILLPPAYAVVTPIPLLVLTQWRIHRGVVYRRVFTAAAMGLAYGSASVVFRAFPAWFAGGGIGSGFHALRWALAVSACELVGGRGHNALIAVAVKIASPHTRLRDQELSREALLGDVTEFNLAVLITIIVAVTPAFSVFAVLMWLMVRRFMMHTLLLARSRIDTKTGLLNASTWEAEAVTEIARAIRADIPVAVALIDIDHFKLVNDTHGHLAGDKVLKAMGDEIRGRLRQTDIAGRFGGEEFVVLLPNAGEADALRVADRLRQHIAATPFPIGADPEDLTNAVKLTISAGVAALTDDCRELTDLMAAADAALYHAKQNGRNKTHAPNVSVSDPKLASATPVDSGHLSDPPLLRYLT
jgi:diguanylate cyclase (GGDEF)-like protein